MAWKLQELVEKEHALMREAHFTGARHAAPAHQAGGGHRMMRRAKGTLDRERRRGVEQPRDGVDGCHLERLFLGEWRHD